MIRGFFDALNYLVLVHVGGEALHLQFARLGRFLAFFVVPVTSEFAFDEAITFVAGSLARATLYGASKFVPCAVHNLGGKREFAALERSFVEELIEKCFLVRLVIAKARDEACDVAALFLVD